MADDFTVVKNEMGKAAVWTFLGLKKRKSDNQIDEKVAVCTTCNAQVKMSGGGTSNMQAHIRRHHSSIYLSTCPIILWTVAAPHDVTTSLRHSSLSSAFLTVSLSPKPVHSLFNANFKTSQDAEAHRPVFPCRLREKPA